MNAWPLLAVDADVFKLILFAVVGLIALIKHFVDANAKAQPRRPAAKPELRPRPPAAPAGRPQMPGDVNEFLRRAAEKRAAEKRAAEQRVAAQRPLANEPAQPPRRLVASKLDQPAGEIIDAQAVDDVHATTRVGAHVDRHLDTREFDERVAHLTHVDQSEALFQAHLQQTFQHHVGQLGSQASDPAASPPPSPAADVPLAALLADPDRVRQAVILNEILQRPVDRWQ